MTYDTETAMRYRSGYYNGRDGHGWQKCTSTLSVEESSRRDSDERMTQKKRRWTDDITTWLRSPAGQEHLRRRIPGFGE